MEWPSVILAFVCIWLVYLFISRKFKNDNDQQQSKRVMIPPFPKGDLTLAELRQYDGKNNQHILVAINRDIFDCTKRAQFYGPDGPYGSLAGHDATRALATFDVSAVRDTWDDTSDLSPSQVTTVNEWYEQFKEKYEVVGRLVKKETEKLANPTDGADDEQEQQPTTETINTT